MELQQLKAYLRGAIDLETAILAGEQAISSIGKEMQRIETQNIVLPSPVYPAQPQTYISSEPQKPTHNVKEIIADIIVALLVLGGKAVIAVIAMVIIASILDSILRLIPGIPIDLVNIVDRLALPLLVLTVVYVVYTAIRHEKAAYAKNMQKYHADVQKRQEQIDEQDRAIADWEHQCAHIKNGYSLLFKSYELLKEQQRKTCDNLRAQRQAINEKTWELRAKLKQYYANGPIYSSYQNLVAVTQIYEYLASGIASELEGPNGAYAQYMNDVRAERICNSLEQIRADMNRELTRILANQQLLYHELQDANDAISKLNHTCSSMSHEIRSASQQITSLANTTNQLRMDVSADLQRLHSGLENVAADMHLTALNTATMGVNQYLDMKARGVDGYLTTYM